MFCNGTEIVDVNEEFFCIYFSLSEHRKKPKDTILDKLESAFADMNAHSYNDYADDSECVIRLNVKELNWLYEQIR